MTVLHRLSAFGLEIEADFPLPGMQPSGGDSGEADVALRRVPMRALEPLTLQPRVVSFLSVFDGCPYASLEGADGDVLFHYGHRALFQLSADRRLLRCAFANEDDAPSLRVLLDTVLWTVSLLRGFELLHASAVETSSGIVAFAGVTGGGKTSLAAEYLRRGARLFSDDMVALDDSGGAVLGYPGPPLMNLPRGLAPEDVGAADVIRDFGEESWVQVGVPALSARSLAAIVLVDRAAGNQNACVPVAGTSLTLLPHAIPFPKEPDRARRRFDLLGELASTTPVLHLTADPSVPTESLADMVHSGIESR